MGKGGIIHMNKKDVKALRNLLIQYRDKVASEISHLSEESLNKSQKDAAGDLSGYAFHMADMATDNYDREFNLGLASNEREILQRIDESLQKIDEGTYGVCEDCESKIPIARLKAMPFASLCVKCQEAKEENGNSSIAS